MGGGDGVQGAHLDHVTGQVLHTHGGEGGGMVCRVSI